MNPVKIPSLALLSLSLTACGKADPIVGTWDATRLAGEEFPLSYADYGGSFMARVHLMIAEDHGGTYEYHAVYTYTGEPDEHDERSYPLTVLELEDSTYSIAIPGLEVMLNCALDGRRLACTDANARAFDFKKR